MAPADLRKAGPAYDLPMAVGILAATKQIPSEGLDHALFAGELSLDGSVWHVRGVLSIAAFAAANGFCTLYIPREDAAEAAPASYGLGREVLSPSPPHFHAPDNTVVRRAIQEWTHVCR